MKIENSENWFMFHLKSIGFKMVYVLALYSILLTNNLVNRQDGIWNSATYMAGDWELSIGRWALKYIDILRFGITINPWTSIIALFLFVLGTEIAVDIFQINVNSKWNYIGSFLFLGNMIICDVLSYSFTSIGYSFAYLLSLLAVKFIISASSTTGTMKKCCQFVLSASVCIALMMGLYQNYLGCVCLLILFCIIDRMLKNEKVVDIARFAFLAIVSGILGLCIYELIQKEELARHNVTMSSYLGANDISLKNIVINLNNSLKRAYYDFFYQNLVGERFKWNYFRGGGIVFLISIVLGIFLLITIRKLWKLDKLYIVYVFGGICLIPLAANICVILAPSSSYWEQQTGPLAMIIPCMIFVILKHIKYDGIKLGIDMLAKRVLIAASVVLIWGSMYQVVIDQESMREGLNNAEVILQSALQQLFSSELFDENVPIAIVGAPFNNNLYYDTGGSSKANIYTRAGGLTWWGNEFDLRAYHGIVENRLGMQINWCNQEFYNALCQRQELLDMPTYPDKECVQIIDDVLVLKISNPQKY